jgi:outer membrane immunogenic protein
MTGWTLGAGVEYKFTESLHAKLEYRYSDYGDFTENYKGMKTDYTTNKVYMGISYKF